MASTSTSIGTFRRIFLIDISKSVGRACFRSSILIVLATLLVTLTISRSVAQLETGSIVGVVTDTTGAVYRSAQVAVENKLTGAKVSLTTNDVGVYDAPVLPLGDYRITATASGFKALVVDDVHVSVGDRKKVDFKLQTGAVTETITVTTTAPLINPAQSEVGDTVTSEKVDNVPLENHSYADLLSLAPGVVNFGVPSASRGNSNWFQSAIRINIDGTDASQVDSDFVGPAYNSNQRLDRGSVDAIQELQVITGNYSAEYGQSNGAILNIVTKSGTNEFHGGRFEYFRNNALDASPNYFSKTKAPLLHINQFGGTIGGPIVENRIFFFANYEGIRQSQPSVFNVLDANSTYRATVGRALAPLLNQVLLPNAGPSSDPNLGIYNGVRSQQLTENNVSFKIDANVTNTDKVSFFNLTEKQSMLFRGEFLNALNHPNWELRTRISAMERTLDASSTCQLAG
jgi:hypothetical protein